MIYSKGGVVLPPYMYLPRMGYGPIPTPYITPPVEIIEEDQPNNVYTNPLYTQAYLKEHIGEYVKVEFLIGTNMLIDREGILKDVGISYIVLQEPETDNLLMADIYSIKFAEFFY